MAHNANEARAIVRAMTPGDTVAGDVFLRQFPYDSIIEAISSKSACVAYRVTSLQWAITGHGMTVTSDVLTKFATTWRVIRVGNAEAERERRSDELDQARQDGIHDGQESVQ